MPKWTQEQIDSNRKGKRDYIAKGSSLPLKDIIDKATSLGYGDDRYGSIEVNCFGEDPIVCVEIWRDETDKEVIDRLDRLDYNRRSELTNARHMARLWSEEVERLEKLKA